MSILEAILKLIKSIPDTFWSALIASVFTLGGVLVSNRGQAKMLKTQLDHDAAEKGRERKLTIRRDVYLHAAEEMVKANGYLASLPQVDIAKINLAYELREFFAAFVQVGLISENETSYLVNELAGLYGELTLDLSVKILPIASLKSQIKTRDEFYEQSQSEIRRILGDRTQMIEAGNVDADRFGRLSRSVDNELARSKKFSEERQQLANELNKELMEFGKCLLIRMKPVAEHQLKVMVAIRSELEIESDLDEFKNRLELQREQMSKKIDEVFAAISKV